MFDSTIVWIRTLDSEANPNSTASKSTGKVGFCVRHFISRNFAIILFLPKSLDYSLLKLLSITGKCYLLRV